MKLDIKGITTDCDEEYRSCINCGSTNLETIGTRRSQTLANCTEEGIICKDCMFIATIPHFDSGKQILPKIKCDDETRAILEKLTDKPRATKEERKKFESTIRWNTS